MFVLEIFYSEEDNGYIAIIPELPGCSAFGENEEKALEEIKMAMELWLETAKKRGTRKQKINYRHRLTQINTDDKNQQTRLN